MAKTLAARIEPRERCGPAKGGNGLQGADPGVVLAAAGGARRPGTPTGWLANPSHHVVNVHCACDLEVAASRFCRRRRHPGHLDDEASYADVLVSLRKLMHLPLLDIGQRIVVDTSPEPDLIAVVRAIRSAPELPA